MAIVDPGLKPYATDRLANHIDAINEHGGVDQACRVLGINSRNIRRDIAKLKVLAASQGYAPGHFSDGVAPGYRMGKVTVQRGPAGVERVWERQSPDAEARHAAMMAMIEGLKDELPRAVPVPVAQVSDDDLLTVYPQGDPHAGLYSLRDETGAAFDLAEYERVNCNAIDQLVAAAPPSGTALFIDLGDSLHADNNKNRTPQSGHELDVDGRHSEAIRVNMRVKRYQIKRMLEKHGQVVYRQNGGNHDPTTATSLAMMLDFIYENEPRVRVVVSPNPYWYYGFGANLIGTCHGDGAKGKDLPLLMATDQPDLWAASAKGSRVWLAGHVHHKDVKDYMGATVEYHRTLAAQDAWSHHAGYRSRRTMEAITFHRADGEIARATVGMVQINRVAT